jgi:hypothetical protein
MKHYFRLQLTILNRQFTELRINPIVGIVFSIFALIGISIILFSKTEYANSIFLVISLILTQRLSEVNRTTFLKICFVKKEYLQLLCNARKVKAPNFEEKNIFELPLNQYAISYSTGMKKKLALTGILLQNNEVLILDEPFNGVDIQSNILITEIILLKNGTIDQHVQMENFGILESEMKEFMIGDKIERLGL